jgi:hypothetical protein
MEALWKRAAAKKFGTNMACSALAQLRADPDFRAKSLFLVMSQCRRLQGR